MKVNGKLNSLTLKDFCFTNNSISISIIKINELFVYINIFLN